MLPGCRKTLRAQKPGVEPAVLRTPGDHVKRRRLEIGLYQRDVAIQLAVSEATVHNWECGKSSPATRTIPRVVEFLGYSPYASGQSLGEQLAAKRRLLGLSRRRLARKIGVDESTLARWEHELRRPSGKWLALVEEFLWRSDSSS